MAKATTLMERGTGETMYPYTHAKMVLNDAGGNIEDDIESAKLALFIDQWNVACGTYGKYDPANAPDPQHPFYLNELWLTYEEAIDIMFNSAVFLKIAGSGLPENTFAYSNIRTHIPLFGIGNVFGQAALVQTFLRSGVEVVIIGGGMISLNENVFRDCLKLKTITILADLPISSINSTCFYNIPLLENLKISRIGASIFIEKSPLLTVDSFDYLITHAANTSAITITVHPDIYVKLTDETNTEWHALLAQAAAKNITFATI